MRVLFVIYRLDFADHIALAHLSAIARELGFIRYLYVLDHNPLRLSEFIEATRPDVVAYSANIMGFKELVMANLKAKKACSFISILGGPQATFFPETFASSGMDAYCVGEGDLAFRDFLEHVSTNRGFGDVPNLITRLRGNPVRPLISNLNTLPEADRDLTLANSHLKHTAKKTFYTSRGCPYSCTYCCNDYYHRIYRGKGPLVRRFSVERMMAEIERVVSGYRTEFVKFGDDTFAWQADEWLEEFTIQYRRRVGLPFNCYLRLDRAEEDLLKLLKWAGCFSVHLSVDSVSNHVREKVLGRKMRHIDITRQLRRIREHGINTWVNYMLAAPESTLQDDLDTIRVNREGRVTCPSYSTTVPMEKTRLYNHCVSHGLIDPATHVGDMEGCNEKSTLSCFNKREKNTRFNIYLMGGIVSAIPKPLSVLATLLLKIIPPNPLFRKAHDTFYRYHLSHTIFRIPEGG